MRPPGNVTNLVYLQNKLTAELMGSFKMFPRPYIVLSVLDEFSTVCVTVLKSGSLTFIKEN